MNLTNQGGSIKGATKIFKFYTLKGGKTHYKNCDQTQNEELMITSLCNRNMGRYYDSYHVYLLRKVVCWPCIPRQGYCV